MEINDCDENLVMRDCGNFWIGLLGLFQIETFWEVGSIFVKNFSGFENKILVCGVILILHNA